jgi:hypothetical protein
MNHQPHHVSNPLGDTNHAAILHVLFYSAIGFVLICQTAERRSVACQPSPVLTQ